jgi:hypothetical protein
MKWSASVSAAPSASVPASRGISTREARAEKSVAGQIVLAAFYWLVLAAFPDVGEPLLEREDFG